jgi:hypothetical protein
MDYGYDREVRNIANEVGTSQAILRPRQLCNINATEVLPQA